MCWCVCVFAKRLRLGTLHNSNRHRSHEPWPTRKVLTIKTAVTVKTEGDGGWKNEALFREAFLKSFFNGHFQERLTTGQKNIIYAPVMFEHIKFIISDILLR